MAEQTTTPAVKIEMVNLPNGNSGTPNDEAIENDPSIRKEIDLDFLPFIYEIIKSIEKDPIQDSSGKNRDTQDTSVKILEFEKKLSEARKQILVLPGIEHSKEEQLKKLEVCRKQVHLKQQLITKLSESYPMRRTAQLVVYFFNKGKAITADSKLTEKLANSNITDRLKRIRDTLEKKKNN